MRSPCSGPSLRSRAPAITSLIAIALAAGCGDTAGVGAPFTPGRVTLVSPAGGVTYSGGPPPLLAALDPTLDDAERASIALTINGVDASDRLVATAGALAATGLADLLRPGANDLVVTFAEETHAAHFTWACGDACTAQKPILEGPTEAVALSQATLYGSHLGAVTSRRVLHLDGEVGAWVGGKFAPNRFVFVAPPERDSVTVEVEVDGVKSDPLVIAITPAPALARSADAVLADSVRGLHDLLGVMRALPVVTSGDAALDGATAELRAALGTEIERELDLVDAQVAALPAEAKALMASFLEQGRLDELLPAWAENLSKADGPAPEYGDCARDLLRVYRLVTYFAVVHDALSGLALTAAFLAVLVPPFAGVAVALSELAAGIATVISNLQLFISLTMPSVEALTVKVPATVERAGQGTVTATVTWAWDPARKVEAIGSWAAHSVMGKLLSQKIAAAGEDSGIGDAVVRLTDDIYGQVHQLAIAARASEAAGGGGETWTAPADPTYVDFRAEHFTLSPSTGAGTCEAIGRWAEDTPCEVADDWTAGGTLAPTGFYAAVFADVLASGAVATSDDGAIESYDDPLYGAWLEHFATGHGCDKLAGCWSDMQSSGECSPGLGDLECNEMVLGSCPSDHDVQVAHQLCVLCGGG